MAWSTPVLASNLRDGRGQIREIFDFDADGSLTKQAQRRLTTPA
jgi:hypothetical protein